jgi:CRP/FNR family transcriptional regulator, cyclic AMP receptor protein
VEAAPSFLSLLTADDRRALEEVTTLRRFPRGSFLLHHGEDPGGVFLLVAGCVKIVAPAGAAGEAVLGFRGPGDLLGDESVMDGRPRSASAAALEPVVVRVCAGSDFRRLVRSHPAVAEALRRVVVDRLREADAERADFGSRDVLGRVARRLSDLTERFGDRTSHGIVITLPISQDELAGWSGASRESVSKALGTLRELGLVETRRRAFLVRDEQELRNLVR